MGYDITVYFNVNQDKIEEFINEKNIDRKDCKQHRLIVDYYKEQNSEMKELEILYLWNRKNQTHDFFDFFGTNFIRDDGRLSDELYIRNLVEKHQRIYPDCLRDINFYLRNVNDAVEIADELTIFFGDDDDLMDFAKWLRLTSKNCAYYELSR